MNFKTSREKEEYDKLVGTNTDLYTIIISLDTFCRLEFHKEITITSVFRTQEEHTALYAQTPPEKRPATSPHCKWNAVDIRSAGFEAEEINRMLAYLNQFKNVSGKPTALYHQIAGGAPHFHIQRLNNK